MIDNDGRLGAHRAPSNLELHEEQRRFATDVRSDGDREHPQPWPAPPIDRELVAHSQAAVDRLTALVTDAVRASDDTTVGALDHVLQHAEALLALARGGSSSNTIANCISQARG